MLEQSCVKVRGASRTGLPAIPQSSRERSLLKTLYINHRPRSPVLNERNRLIASVENSYASVRHDWKTATLLLQLRILRLGFFPDGDIGVGVFPEGDEISVGGERGFVTVTRDPGLGVQVWVPLVP